MEGKTIYYISEASKLVRVEPHVLRYWEEELSLAIGRNEMGHRSYTKEDIERFRQIKHLKEQGLQLKAIRQVLHGDNTFPVTPTEQEMTEKVEDMVMKKAKKYMVTMTKGKETVMELPGGDLQEYAESVDDEKAKKAARLQYLLQHLVTDAVKNANREMCTEIKESILKELDYQFRQQEERDEAHWKQEEEHYRKIDEMIRQRHQPRERFGMGKKKDPLPQK
ncbi:MAG: helix-turn-helix domain-containing protein [Lachnospiraceae bacterium]|nr:helix-turn-helix domain-containing protein [Lachnospiraceae bacterium]